MLKVDEIVQCMDDLNMSKTILAHLIEAAGKELAAIRYTNHAIQRKNPRAAKARQDIKLQVERIANRLDKLKNDYPDDYLIAKLKRDINANEQ